MTIAACARYWPTCAPDLPTDAKADATRRRMTFVPLPVLQVDNEPRVRDGYISLDTRGHARTLNPADSRKRSGTCSPATNPSLRQAPPTPWPLTVLKEMRYRSELPSSLILPRG